MDKDLHRFRNSRTLGVASLIMVVGLVSSLALWPIAASAMGSTYYPQAKPNDSLTIKAGGTATLTVRGFCMDFGKPFPTQETTIKGLADDKVRAALNYSIQKGYTEGNPQQVEQAVWFLRDNTWHNPDHPVGQEIVTNATTANAPQAGSGTALNDAVTQNKVTLTAKFVAQTADHFYGDAQIQVKNSGTADVTVYMPIGMVFTVPTGGGAFQDLAAYTLSAAPAQQATSTAGPAITATMTVGTSPTSVTTATTAATTVATVVETATSEPVATAAPTETSAPIIKPTNTSGVLPQTGAGDDNIFSWALALMALSLLVIGSGAVLASKRHLY